MIEEITPGIKAINELNKCKRSTFEADLNHRENLERQIKNKSNKDAKTSKNASNEEIECKCVHKKACEEIYDYITKGFDNANLIWSKQHIIELTNIKKACRFDNNGVCEALGCYSGEQCFARDKNGDPNYKYNLDKEVE